MDKAPQNRLFLGVGLLAFLVGLGIGGFAVRIYDQRIMKQAPIRWESLTVTAQIIRDVNVLTALRQGKDKLLADETEMILSHDIYLLQQSVPKALLSELDTSEILRRAARYRSEHPFKLGDGEIDPVVEEVLAKAASDGTFPASTPK